MPGCVFQGDHRAPKDRALTDYHYFCTDHVAEYNRAWNYFSGMAPQDIEDHIVNSMTGERPTWRYDNFAGLEEHLRHKATQARFFTEQNEQKSMDGHGFVGIDRNSPEYEAMVLMGLAPPLTLDSIKARYRDLVKEHHPDRNKRDPAAEERLKRINMAYTILKVACQKFASLPS
ncbi:MAG: J domain-containing protein [Alphaproteobacteria bacterium]|nr:J domain-containing protein [Alphaproteobacteria bacterium]